MKAASFCYHAPQTVDETVELLHTYAGEAKILAGGQSLVPLMAMRLARFEHLVDIGRVTGLGELRVDDEGISVSAMVRQAAAGRSDEVRRVAPLVSRAIPFIGHFQIRNLGTVVGSLAHADPASELPAVALALDAEFRIVGVDGSRLVPAADFFVGMWTTALRDGELLAAVHFPRWPGRAGFAVEELARRHGDFAVAGAAVAVALTPSGGVERAAIALFGIGSTPVRTSAAERDLVGTTPSAADLVEIGERALVDIDPVADLYTSGAYRKSVAAAIVTRALTNAIEEAQRA